MLQVRRADDDIHSKLISYNLIIMIKVVCGPVSTEHSSIDTVSRRAIIVKNNNK